MITKKSNPTVSIILPTYNRNELLPRAIRSVLVQTYPDWELIIWDDGSTVPSWNIVDSYADERISYFYEKNHGVAYARNRAIKQAQGKYVAFLDSDDVWLNDKLSLQVQVLNYYPNIDLLFTDFDNINLSNDKVTTGFYQNKKALRSLKTKRMSEDLFLIQKGIPGSLAVENFIATDTIMLRKDLFKYHNLFLEELRNSEDFELWWRLGLEQVTFAYINKVLMIRYKLLNNLSGSSISTFQSSLAALDNCKEKSLQLGRDDLIPKLNKKYRNTWQNILNYYADKKNFKMMNQAFMEALKYGLRIGTFRLWFKGLLSK